jgi:hypothetical protein
MPAQGIAELGWLLQIYGGPETRAMLAVRKLAQKELLETESSQRGILRSFRLKVGKTTPVGSRGVSGSLLPDIQAIIASALLSVRGRASIRGHGC